MKILFLDDSFFRKQQLDIKLRPFDNIYYDWVQTSKQAIEFLQKNKYDLIMLDHDLGGKSMEESGPGTGYEVAQWIKNNMKNPPKIFIHSHNPVGAKNMQQVLPKAHLIPFSIFLEKIVL